MEVDFFSWWNTCGYVLILIFSILSGLVEGMCVFLFVVEQNQTPCRVMVGFGLL